MSKKNGIKNTKKVKKNKKPGKISTFFGKYKKIILCSAAGICVAALVVSVVIFAVNAATSHIPYNVKLSKYVDVPTYMGITIKNEDIQKEFDKQKKELLLKAATYEALTEGKIEEGYRVTVDTKGYLLKEDGTREEKTFSSGTLTDYVITDIGNHYTENGVAFSSEIQEAIIGKDIKEPGEIKATVKYPSDYAVDEVKGKTAEFDITLKKVEKTILPGYTDTYVLAKTVYKNIEEYEEATNREIRENLVWNAIVKGTTVKKFYKPKVDEYITEFVTPYNDYMDEKKMTFDELLKELKIDQATFLNNRDTYAYGLVREEMILYYIARAEEIDVSDTEYKTIGKEVAIESGYSSLADFESNLGEDDVMRSVLWEKVKRILVSNAKFE